MSETVERHEFGAEVREALKDAVSEVRATDRLVESAVVLAAPPHGPDLQMQRMLRRAGQGHGGGLPVLEVNPRHPLIHRLAEGDVADTPRSGSLRSARDGGPHLLRSHAKVGPRLPGAGP